MAKVRVSAIGMSIDGYSAGPNQSLENPLGVRGEELMQWMFATRGFHRMLGQEGGATGIDDDFFVRGFENMGAWIIGRNMFGPVRGPWPDETWRGWWGENPPFHVPVFVLTHHARPTLPMEGGNTFYFVTDGIHAALDRARAAGGGKDIRIGGGPATIQQFLRAGLVDEMHLGIAPVLLGSGEPLFANLDLYKLGYRCVERVASPSTTHVIIRKQTSS